MSEKAISKAIDVTAIVLAGGKGVRMHSQKPKILHTAAGLTLIEHVLNALEGAGLGKIRLVVGYGGDLVKQHLSNRSVSFFIQPNQLGTADAVKSADIESLRGDVLIGMGDHPLICSSDYTQAIDEFHSKGADILVVTATVKNPHGFGRILRDGQGSLFQIVEERDATGAQKKIKEINSGLYVVKGKVLKDLLPLIKNNNAKNEFYLTDIIQLGLDRGLKVDSWRSESARVCRGVNSQGELALAARALYKRKTDELLGQGVLIIDPSHTYIDLNSSVGSRTIIGPGCMISGSSVGSDCTIEAHCQIISSKIGDGTVLKWGTLVDQSGVAEGAILGPYARLRPGTSVGAGAHVGNFVELKKTRLGAGAKANHLTYLGDAEIGENTNIGCGTITCNYAVDQKKYKTTIGKNVFVGSDTQFVAPVSIGDGAVIGSGSTITKDVPANALAVARSRQFVKPDYKKR